MRLIPLLLLFLLLGCSEGEPGRRRITVSAAASLTDVLSECAREFEKLQAGIAVDLNFAGSGSLQKQIEQGAPVDVFISASPKEIDALAAQGLIVKETRLVLAANELVLIGSIDDWKDLPKVDRIAISNPETAPAGRYARQVLEAKGLWRTVQPKLVIGENVRQTLAYIKRGDSDAGLVFATDAASADLPVRARANPGEHNPIGYSAAVIAASARKDLGRDFIAFLAAKEGQAIFHRHGFTTPDRSAEAK